MLLWLREQLRGCGSGSRCLEQAWRAALDSDGEPRDGAQVAELTAYLPHTLTGWPAGMRVIARRERPHPGAQLRLTDENGWRITCFATNTKGPGWTLAALEVRHRQRARAEDRIRGLKDTGLRNLPFHGFAQNPIWLEIVALAAELLVWAQTLAWHDHPARRWEPKRLRFRLLSVAGRIIRTGRRQRLRLPRSWPWNQLIDTGWAALQPGRPQPQDPTTRTSETPATPRRHLVIRQTGNHQDAVLSNSLRSLTKDRG